ncbi:MAG: phenylacetate--CoA ligase family protein [Candidatus Rokuibacteriota bacterium]
MHPLLVNKLFFPVHERLKGKRTFEWLRTLEASQWLAPERLIARQLARLREHLELAYTHVPYYRRLFDEHGIQPRAIQSLEDFKRVPFLTRERLRSHFEDLKARVRLRGVQALATGGSTGSPVSVLIDAERMAIGDGIRLRAHRWFGLEPGAPEVVLWGSPIEITKQDRLRVLRDRLLDSTLLSAFDMSEPMLARYAHVIGRRRPEKMYGYASAFYLLARYLHSVGWRPPQRLRAIFTTAEPLFDFQRETIRSVFGAAVATEYGSRDAGLTANECPDGSLHVPAEGILVEVDGAGPNGLGEIVVTNLYSPAMPIIRYRTGDLGRLDPTPCACGRGLPRLSGIEGRKTDFLVTPDGRILHALSIIYILRDTPGLEEFRIIQDAEDRVTALVVPNGSFDGSARARLVARIERLLGPQVTVTVEAVAACPVDPSGKFRYVVSRVADGHIERLLAGAAGGRNGASPP